MAKLTRDFEPLPYFAWYWRDFRSSRRVQRLDYVARGLYRELIDECWAKGGIPNDVELLAEICGCPVGVMRKAWKQLEAMFTPIGAGVLVCDRVEQERTQKDRERAANSRAGIRSGERRRELAEQRLKASQANESERALNEPERPLNENERTLTLVNGDERTRTDPEESRTSSSSSSSSSSSRAEQSSSSSAREDVPSRSVAALAPQEARGAGWQSIHDALEAGGAHRPIGFDVPSGSLTVRPRGDV